MLVPNSDYYRYIHNMTTPTKPSPCGVVSGDLWLTQVMKGSMQYHCRGVFGVRVEISDHTQYRSDCELQQGCV